MEVTDYRLIYPIIFALAISLHNLEEAIWLPDWSKNAGKYYKPVSKNEFRFAVLMITVLAYLCSFSVVAFGYDNVIGKIQVGFMGAMVLNTFFPHLMMTIVMRRYSPGLLTGMLINVPVFGVMIFKIIGDGVLSYLELVIYTIAVATVLLVSIRSLFRLSKRLLNFE